MKTAKKLISLLLPVVIIIGFAGAMPASAAAPRLLFEDYVLWSLGNYAPEIEAFSYGAQFNWDVEKLSSEFISILNKNPQIFHVEPSCLVTKKVSVNTRTGEVVSGTFKIYNIKYTINKSEYDAGKKKFDAEVNKALKYAEKGRTDLEKALLVHDYLALTNTYDQADLDYAKANNFTAALHPNSHTAYGAMVGKLAVCEGYAKSYMYIMQSLGIDCATVTGRMNTPHMWNYIKIDGKWYHVDVTSDDPLYRKSGVTGSFDLLGAVNHKYFLLSDAALTKLGTHSGWNMTGYPKASSTVYDNYFWKTVDTTIIPLGKYWYYIQLDKTSPGYSKANREALKASSTNAEYNANFFKMYSVLKAYDPSTKKTSSLKKFESTWFAGGTENNSSKDWLVENYSRIASYNGKIYFNTSKEILCYDPASKKTSSVSKPSGLGGTGNKYIFGMTMSGNKIKYTVKTQYAANDTFKTKSVAVADSAGITLSKTSATVSAGNAGSLKATLSPSDSADYIYWVSSDTGVAAVSADGKVTGIAKGDCTVTAFTETGVKKTCKISVT